MFYKHELVLHDCYNCKPVPVYMIEGTSATLCKKIGRLLRNKYDETDDNTLYWYSFMDTHSDYQYSQKDEFDPRCHDINIALNRAIHQAATATTKILEVVDTLMYDKTEHVILDTNFFRCIIDAIAIGSENIDWIFELNKYPLCAVIPTAIFYVTSDKCNTNSHIMEKIRGWYAAYIAEMKSHTNVIAINGDKPIDQIFSDIEYEINRIEGRYRNE